MADLPANGLKPGATIGIMGGGQLGRMLAMAAARLGFRTVIYEPEADCPASQTANRHVVASYADESKLEEFARHCDVVTYEFENIPLASASLISRLMPLRPGLTALETSQDRLAEKSFISSLGIATAPFCAIETAAEAGDRLAEFGGRGILKTRRLGYDGKGQVVVNDPADARDAFQALYPQPVILEGFIDFAFEISVIAARSASGDFAAYDCPRNLHEGGILRRSNVPAQIGSLTQENAEAIARRIMEALDYVGVMGTELFVVGDGSLLFNEIAPRVHNSGHWTETACATSQFENHIRAVAGLPLGSPARHSDCEMENLIGHDIDRLPDLLAESGAAVHLYGKREVRDGRKMGHVNRIRGA